MNSKKGGQKGRKVEKEKAEKKVDSNKRGERKKRQVKPRGNFKQNEKQMTENLCDRWKVEKVRTKFVKTDTGENGKRWQGKKVKKKNVQPRGKK